MSSVTTGRVGVQHGNWASRAHLCVALGMKAPNVNLRAARTEWGGTRPTWVYGPQKGTETSSLGLLGSVSEVIKLVIFECFMA